jgi:hypothetical protein
MWRIPCTCSERRYLGSASILSLVTGRGFWGRCLSDAGRLLAIWIVRVVRDLAWDFADAFVPTDYQNVAIRSDSDFCFLIAVSHNDHSLTRSASLVNAVRGLPSPI